MARDSSEQYTIVDKGSFDVAQLKSDSHDKSGPLIVHTPLCERLPILNPYGTFKVRWDIVLTILLLISIFETPYTLAFQIELHEIPKSLQMCLLSIDIFLCIDIMLTIRTAIPDEYDLLQLVDDPVLIAKHYLRFWFWFDLLTSFPFDFVFTNQSVEGFASYIRILRSVRVIRMFRIVRVVRVLSQNRGKFSMFFISNFASDLTAN